ncbi:lamin tail domain-containing protein [Pedobacter arcticus]|uniref:lamin tail domain-containing protein n=1 Tax=Pedobacter arcticus TaxID=752140 RepID=UPI0002D632FE|nr:lamin tail domain-containing protein [Pedobacter arcticus]
MGKFLLFFSLFIANVAFSQVNDAFNDGDFTQNPVWQGDAAGYFVNSSKQLQTVNSGNAQTVYLYTANSLAINAKWEFFLKMDFDPSTSNFCRVYLLSDKTDLSGALNGYFLQIGESGALDSYDLYKQSGTTITKIIDGPDKNRGTTEIKARVQVSRDGTGLWKLKTDIDGGTNYTTEGTVVDNTFITSNYFGFRSSFTATRSGMHYYDDILITELVPDVSPPVFTKASTNNGKEIVLSFDEAVDVTDASLASHYSINPGNIQPASVAVSGSNVTLTLTAQLSTADYTVSVSSVKDLKGNTATSQSKGFNYKKPYLAGFKDIVINEVFADPSPQVDLPSTEFVELWNRTTEDVALSGFKYSDATTTYTFTGDTIKANQYVILCAKTDTLEFKKYGEVIGISPWPSLNNAGDNLKLVNQNGTLISEVNYQDSWYKDDTKKPGGWSLELIDPLSVCKHSQNYSASKDASGGTPGKQNSIYLSNKTTDLLKLLSVSLKDSVTLTLVFNRGLDSLQATLPSHYDINNGVGSPTSVNPLSPAFSAVELKYTQAINRNQNYTLTVDGLTDCGSNILANQKMSFIYPGLIVKGDILINEVLFNPRPGGVDFVEVYNASDKILDFKDLKIATIATTKDSVISIKDASTSTILFEPKSYWVITTNPDSVKAQYTTANPNNFIKLSSLPTYANDKGKVVILAGSTRLDQLDYTKDMHFALLKDVVGVSLERSSFTLPTNATGNFRSATATSGYATPAGKNSQYLEDLVNATEEISLPSQTFSPDNDGFEDILRIQYQFPVPSKVANVTIYNNQGRLVKKLISNETLNTEGQWVWDGLDQTNAKAKTGIYIIYVEVFELDGNVKSFKKTVALASKFN